MKFFFWNSLLTLVLVVNQAHADEFELRTRMLRSMVPKRKRTLQQTNEIEAIAIPTDEKTLTNYTVTFPEYDPFNKMDFIGLFPCVDEACSTLNIFPIQYKPVVKGVTTMNFTVRAMPGVNAFRFSYINNNGGGNYPNVIYQSDVLETAENIINMPMQIRISRVRQSTSKVDMRIMWSQSPYSVSASSPLKDILDRFRVRVWDKTGVYKSFSVKNVFNYDSNDFCDNATRPAATIGYVNPGLQVEVLAFNLDYNKTYFYKIIDSHGKSTSEKKFFLTGSGPHQRTVMAILGDQGQSMVQIDGALEHSWAEHGMAQKNGPASTKLMTHLAEHEDVTSFLHIGDLSYAVGTLSIWDAWLFQNEPVTSRYAYMVAIGNHEMDYSGSFVNGTDSEGECGVPYTAFFPFANQEYSRFDKTPTDIVHSKGNKNPWYSYDNGLAHITVMSAEHNFTKGSAQYMWLESDLAKVDRSVTPWSIFVGHRPMYISTNSVDYYKPVADLLVDNIEPMLGKYDVNMAFWGHHHSSQRSCPGLFESECNQKQGLVHFVVGGAGFSLSGVNPNGNPLFQFADNTTFGFPVVDLVNETDAHVRFFDNSNFEVVDDSWVKKK